MFHKACEHIINKAADNDLIQEALKPEYVYGLELIVSAVINYSTIIAIGAIMNMTAEAVAFLIIYTTMRRYIGGFHFNSQIICYLSNFIVCPLVLCMIKYLYFNAVVYTVIFTVLSVLLLRLAPIPAENKAIDEKEEKIYKMVSYFLIIIIAVIYIICLHFNFYAAKVITISVFMVSVFAIAGSLKLQFRKKT